MICSRCDGTAFLEPLTIRDGIILEYLCVYCEVTDVEHSDCRLSKEEEQDSGHLSKKEYQDRLDGVTCLLQEH